MMRRLFVLFLAGLFAVMLVPTANAQIFGSVGAAAPPVRAPYGQPYFFGHFGIFEPNDKREGLSGYDSGAYFDVGIGSNVAANLAIEGTIGVYSADGPGDVVVLPVTVGARVVIPTRTLEPYAGAGVGFYHVDVEQDSPRRIDDSDLTIGAYGMLGVDAWMTPKIALNIEGKYHWAEPSLSGYDVKVSGWMLTLGVRVGF
ncbi:MAG: outer membrane beta-barrel protein [Pseudomonadota bacterium]